MAIAPVILKKNYANLSVEELEAKYDELKKSYCFESKDDQIKSIIKNYLNSSYSANTTSVRKALEEVLKEKTGKEYSIEPKTYEINLADIIKFLSIANPSWENLLTEYLQKLPTVTDQEKMRFLVELIQDRASFNDFTREISNTQDVESTYNKYKQIASEYVSHNKYVC